MVGGAETLARNVSERLQRRGFDVTVLTTTAADYVTWENQFPAGESILRGVLIRRFVVDETRDIEEFNRESDWFFATPASERNESEWIRQQGPYCPGLIAALEKEQENFDLFLFFTYLYYPTVMGIPVVKKPVILFPTAHDEAPLYLNAMKPVFEKPDVLMFLTRAEMDLVGRVFAPKNKMELVRTGLDTDEQVDDKPFRARHNLVAHYLLYAGRIEKGKGLETVFNAFRAIRSKDYVDLVLIGKKLMEIPGDEGIKYLGYVSEEEKLAAFKGAMVSLQPSPLESLSITTLESFSQKTPVLVNRTSPALARACHPLQRGPRLLRRERAGRGVPENLPEPAAAQAHGRGRVRLRARALFLGQGHRPDRNRYQRNRRPLTLPAYSDITFKKAYQFGRIFFHGAACDPARRGTSHDFLTAVENCKRNSAGSSRFEETSCAKSSPAIDCNRSSIMV